jgi:hypothetical protein
MVKKHVGDNSEDSQAGPTAAHIVGFNCMTDGRHTT